MPTIDIDMFDDAPKVGDKVKVMGKVLSINEDDGTVKVSYDDASIVDKKKRKKRRDTDDDFEDDVVDETVYFQGEPMTRNSQSLDQALSQSFPTTQ